MGYSSVDAIKNFVKSDGTKAGSVGGICTYLKSKTHRAPLTVAKNNICGSNVIDVVAIGYDYIKSTGKFIPVIASLDMKTLTDAATLVDTTDPDTIDTYFSDVKPVSANYSTGLLLPGVRLKSADLTKCNSYLSKERVVWYCGATSHGAYKWKSSDTDYWNQSEIEHSGNLDTTAVTELSLLFYTTKVMEELNVRMGYRTPNPNDRYNWKNWLIVSDDGLPSINARYFKLMYLTEFDFYMHAGAIANPTVWLDKYLAQSTEFSNMVTQVINPNYHLVAITD